MASSKNLLNKRNDSNHSFHHQGSEKLAPRKSVVDEKTPEKIVALLDAEDFTLDMSIKVKDAIKAAKSNWLPTFFELGGLSGLLLQLVKVQGLSDKTQDEMRIQFELLLAVKSVMSNQNGLDQMLDQPDLIASLALNIDSEDTAICTQTLELLAVLMATGEAGARIVLDALDFFKLVTRERVRFQCLVDALYSKDTSFAFKRDIMLFLNAILSTANDLEERLEVRADLIYSGIVHTLDHLKQTCFDELGKAIDDDYDADSNMNAEIQELETQLQIFETVMQRDVAECVTDLETTFQSAEVDLSDPEQIFQSLHASSVEHECFMPFLSVLQSLLVIPSYDTFGKIQWEIIDELVQKVVSGDLLSTIDENELNGILSKEKYRLSWKQRVEELSHQNDHLSTRCQEMEQLEVALKEELEDLRNKESVMLFMREKDKKQSEIQARQLRHLQELRESEREVIARAEEILANHPELVQQYSLPNKGLSMSKKSMSTSGYYSGILRQGMASPSNEAHLAPGPVSRPVSRVHGSRHLLHVDPESDEEHHHISYQQSKSSSDNPIHKPLAGRGFFNRIPPQGSKPKFNNDTHALSAVTEDDVAGLMFDRTMSMRNLSNRSITSQTSSHSLLKEEAKTTVDETKHESDKEKFHNPIISSSPLPPLPPILETRERSISQGSLPPSEFDNEKRERASSMDSGVKRDNPSISEDKIPSKEEEEKQEVQELIAKVREVSNLSQQIQPPPPLSITAEVDKKVDSPGKSPYDSPKSYDSPFKRMSARGQGLGAFPDEETKEIEYLKLKRKLVDAEVKLQEMERELSRQKDILRDKEEEFKRKMNKAEKKDESDPRDAIMNLLAKSIGNRRVSETEAGKSPEKQAQVKPLTEEGDIGADAKANGISALQNLFGARAKGPPAFALSGVAPQPQTIITDAPAVVEKLQPLSTASIFKPAVGTCRKPPIPPALPQEAFYILPSLNDGIPMAPPLPGAQLPKDNKSKPKKPTIEPRVPMRSLFWTKIPDRFINSTIWENLSDENVKLDVDQLEALFCKAPVKASKEEKKVEKGQERAKSTEKQKDVTLLDSKIQQNVGIALAKYRMPSNEIRKAIIRMDETRLDLEKLNSLRALAPTPDDISTLKEYDGDVDSLGRVEKFFMLIMDIPRYTQRLECFIFKQKFQLLVAEAYVQFDIFSRALDQVTNSKSLGMILETTLAIGNYLNGGTPRGGVYGFKLDGLLKLATVKSVDNKLSLMHFLCMHCESIDSTIQNIDQEFSAIEECTRINLDTLRSDVNSLKKNLNNIGEEISILQKEKLKDPQDRFVDVLMPFKNEAMKEYEKLESEFNNLHQRFLQVLNSFGEEETMTAEDFFTQIRDFTNAFTKAFRDNEKRRILQEKAEMKKAADERKRRLKAEKQVTSTEIENLVEDVFGIGRIKSSNELLFHDALKTGSGIGSRRKKQGQHRRPKPRNFGAIEEDSDKEDDQLQNMLNTLGFEPAPKPKNYGFRNMPSEDSGDEEKVTPSPTPTNEISEDTSVTENEQSPPPLSVSVSEHSSQSEPASQSFIKPSPINTKMSMTNVLMSLAKDVSENNAKGPSSAKSISQTSQIHRTSQQPKPNLPPSKISPNQTGLSSGLNSTARTPAARKPLSGSLKSNSEENELEAFLKKKKDAYGKVPTSKRK